MIWKAALVVLTLAANAAAKKVCCDRIGCFNEKDGPMSHLPDPTCPEDIGVEFHLYTRDNPDTTSVVTVHNISYHYNLARPSIFTVHGWMSDKGVKWMPDLVSGLLKHFDANVIVADWKEGSNKVYYPKSAANVQTVGAAIAELMNELVREAGVDYKDLWCIGFSLGAHACGHAGMRTDGQIGRITGLDPAGPSFTGRDVRNGINPSAAKFVDVIHTDGAGLISYYGMLEPRGHMDFYPNQGRDQPGCYFGRKKRDALQEYSTVECMDFEGWIDLESCPYNPFIGCSHFRGIYYFIDTLVDDKCHIARSKCTDSTKIPDSCEATADTRMGVQASQNKLTEGLFYLKTGRRSPFCQS